jgi:hypothetical protein
MGISIGRVGLDIDGLQTPLGNGGYARQGDVLRLQGRMRASTATDGLWLREQLLGLAGNPDEPWVRLLWADAQHASGLYTVEDVAVDSFGLTLTTGGSPYSVTLRRLDSFAAPQFETWMTYGGPLVNGHGATEFTPQLGLPGGSFSAHASTNAWSLTQASTRAASGVTALKLAAPSSYSNGVAYQGQMSWACPVDNVYDGTVSIEVAAGPSSELRTLVGRQVAGTYAASGWRVTNGLIRVTPNAGKLAVSVWDGAAWTTAKEYTITGSSYNGPISAFTGLAVLRNSPDQCVIRLWCTSTPTVAIASRGVLTLDVAVTRGHRHASCAISTTDTLNNDTWRVERTTNEAGASLGIPTTVGLRANANDASGDRYVLVSDYGTTLTAASGRITAGALRRTLRFGVGLEVDGSGAAAGNTAATIAGEFMSAMQVTTTVRSR